MTDKEKLEKIKALADKMYSRMAYLTSDTRPIRQAMDEYHQFIINEYHKEEPASEDLEQAIDTYLATYFGGEKEKQEWPFLKKMAIYFAGWQKEQFEKDYTNLCNGIATAKGLAVSMAYDKGVADAKEQMMAKAVDIEVKVDAGGYPYIPQIELYDYCEDIPLAKEGDKYKVILIKED